MTKEKLCQRLQKVAAQEPNASFKNIECKRLASSQIYLLSHHHKRNNANITSDPKSIFSSTN